MLKLLSLSFKNIRSFDSEQTLDFSHRDKLIQVDGRNENTGGSSGAGKTSIFMSLDYLLGISDVPATVLQSRLTKEPIEVTGHFLSNEVPITITRSKKSGLTIQTPSETISGNVKLAEEKLDDIIGIPRKIFRKMVHKKQKEGGFFLNMTAKETYEFFISILGLDKYILQSDKISENIKKMSKEIEACSSDIDRYQGQVRSLEDVLKAKEKPICKANQKDLDRLSESRKVLEGVLLSIDGEKSQKIQSIAPPKKISRGTEDGQLQAVQESLNALINEEKEIESNMQALLNKYSECQQEIGTIQNVVMKEAQGLGQQIKALKEKEVYLKQSTCPTCKQQWVDKNIDTEIVNVNQEADRLIQEVLAMKARIEQKPILEENLAQLNQAKDKLSGQINDIKTRKNALSIEYATLKEKNTNAFLSEELEYNKKIKDLEDSYRSQIDAVLEKLGAVDTEIKNQEFILKSYNEAMAVYQKEVDHINKAIADARSSLKSNEEKRQVLVNKVSVAEEAKRLIKSYIITTFSDTLDSIGDMATQVLSSIPNMANCTVYFESCKETQSGNIKDEVNVVINMEGVDAIPVKSLSGGERTAIDLAIDLAIIDTVEAKVGKGADFFVIDEPFDGLDSICKENCLEVLRQVDTNKKIIMVDHSSELKEMVSDVITVVKQGESSTVL